MAIEPRERLILALDVPSADEAKRLLDRVRDSVAFVKIGLELFMAAGPDIVRWALAQRKRVFLDLKLLDIGETVKRATAAAAELGVTFLTVHATGQTVRAAVEGRGRSAMKILAVTVLTSFDEADLVEMGIAESVRDTVLKRARLAISFGADGVVASGVEAAMNGASKVPVALTNTPRNVVTKPSTPKRLRSAPNRPSFGIQVTSRMKAPRMNSSHTVVSDTNTRAPSAAPSSEPTMNGNTAGRMT